MKAVRVHGTSQPPLVEEIDAPRPGAGRTIVRMAAASVAHLDRTVWQGRFFTHPPFPYTPGVEAAGIVEAGGPFAPGQRVWLRGCGLGLRLDGTWRELIDAPDEAIGPLPDGVPMELGAAFFSPCTSAWAALHDVARVRPGERVLVTGASGAVGALAVQLALEAGARVDALLRDPAGAARLPSGADAWTVDTLQAAPRPDVLIDTVGGPVLEAVLPRVVPGGRAVLVGYTAGAAIGLDLTAFLQRDVALLPLNMARREAAARTTVPELLARLADGRLVLPIRRFRLQDAAAALDWLVERGREGRAVLVP